MFLFLTTCTSMLTVSPLSSSQHTSSLMFLAFLRFPEYSVRMKQMSWIGWPSCLFSTALRKSIVYFFRWGVPKRNLNRASFIGVNSP